MTHDMKLHHTPFVMIKNGVKTFEIRLNDEKRKLIQIGDKIVFHHIENENKIYTELLNLHLFKDFQELYEHIDLLKCGYAKKDLKDARYTDMYQYYSKAQEQRYGVLAIEIKIGNSV